LINNVAEVINNDTSIKGKIKVVFIEDYRVSNAEWIFAAADVSEQISTASKEASGTGNMKFMLNGALTLGTLDGANVEIVEEVGEENAFIFGLSADEVIEYEKNGGYDPMQYFNSDADIRNVLMQLINGKYSGGDMELFRDLYNSLLYPQGGNRADVYFILADFKGARTSALHVEFDTLEIQYNLGDIFDHIIERIELVLGTIDTHRSDRSSLERGKQNTTQ
jgi:starch phosphorylase